VLSSFVDVDRRSGGINGFGVGVVIAIGLSAPLAIAITVLLFI